MTATPIESGLPSPATLMFDCLIQDIMPIINRLPIHSANDDEQYEMLVNRQIKMIRNMILPEIMLLFQ